MAHLKPFTPAKNQIPHRNTHVVINDLAVAFRSVVIAKDLHRPNHFYTWSIRRYNDDALLVVPVLVVRIALAEYKMDGTSRVACSADPPLRKVRDIHICHKS